MFQAPGTAITGALFGVVWSAGINMVCQSGYATAAWVLALVPSLVLGMAAIAVVAALTAVPHHQLVTKSRVGKEGAVGVPEKDSSGRSYYDYTDAAGTLVCRGGICRVRPKSPLHKPVPTAHQMDDLVA